MSGAIDFIKSLTGGRIFLIGRSLGGTTSICRSSGDQRVDGVCTWAAPADLTETFLKSAQPLLEKADKIFRVPEDKGDYLIGRGFFEDLVNYDVIAAVRRISPRPLLIIHGTADETVSIQQGRDLFEAAGEPKSRLFVPGDDHRFTKHCDLVEKTTLGNI